MRPPPEEGASCLPNTGSASAYPCAEDIIACFVELGKMGEKPRRGESSSHRLRRCQPPLTRGPIGAGNSPPCERGDTAEGGGWIPFPRPVIARRGKAPTWQSVPSSPLPPPLGEVPPQGAERVSPAKKKSPGGGLGIDFFPYHVILKIKRGAAGRREPLND